MSTTDGQPDASPALQVGVGGPRDDYATTLTGLATRRMASSFRFVAFWAAVVLPFLYVPVVLTGVEPGVELYTVLTLIALHAVTVFAGHRYGSD